MLLYCFVWYLFTIITYGVWVPAGLFLPGIIIGCALGSIYQDTYEAIYGIDVGSDNYTFKIVPIILAVGSMLSAYCRMTYSLVVIMLETSEAINIFVPMLIAVMVSHFVAMYFTPSLYATTIKTKKIPILPQFVPKETRGIEV